MQFIDLKTQYGILKEQIQSGINTVLEHGQYIMGPEIAELEKKLAAFTGVKHCVACSSGTDALLMPLMAWSIGPGDAVFVPAFTFIATAEVVRLVGATPVFVDVDPHTFNMSPESLANAIERVINQGKFTPRAIIPVDLFGLPADYEKLEAIAEKNELLLLEDAAQGFGGQINKRKAGSWGDAAATSFFPAKPLGCYGDGGAIFTNDDELHQILLSIRVHGQGADKYTNVRVGINGRLDSIQAAILIAKLTIFKDELDKRNKVAALYSKKLANKVVVPKIPKGYISSWAQYSVLCESSEQRTEIQQKLKDKGIPTAIYYPIPLHRQDAFNNIGFKEGSLTNTEKLSERILSLPMHPYLTETEINKICSFF